MKRVLILLMMVSSILGSEIGVVVNRDLIRVGRVRDVINRYIWDLEMEGVNVWVDSVTFDDDQTVYRRRVLRDSLRVHWRDKGLEGAVLVGELPVAMYEEWVNKGGVYTGDNGPVDYYFMDLDEELDTAWHDDSTNEPYLIGYYDRYSRENIEAEIWVSRVIGHNFYYRFDDGATKMREDSVICAYFDRVHRRVIGELEDNGRVLWSGDYSDFPNIQDDVDSLGCRYDFINYPYDVPVIWDRGLRKRYRMAIVEEHSSDNSHVFARDHEENNGRYISSYLEGLGKKDRAFTNIFKEGDSVGVLFFHDLGCSNLDYSKDNCLGAMYGMLGGLICFGATTDYFVKDFEDYFSDLRKGRSFGEAYKRHVNELESMVQSGSLVSLIGVGTLKFLPYMENNIYKIRVDSVSVKRYKKDDGYYLHGDTLELRAYVREGEGAIYKWYGYTDSIMGNNLLFVLDGYKVSRLLPLYGIHHRELPVMDYRISLYVDKAGYIGDSYVKSLPGWNLKYEGGYSVATGIYDIKFERREGGWNTRIQGITTDSNSCISYNRSSVDKFSCYEAICRVDAINNVNSNSGRGGIKVWSIFPGEGRADLSIRKDKKICFDYIDGMGSNVKKYRDWGNIEGTYLKIRRIYQNVYGYVSRDGKNYELIDTVRLGVPYNRSYIGFYFSSGGDYIDYSEDNPKEVVFGYLSLRAIDTVVQEVERIKDLFASESLVINDRDSISGIIGAGKSMRIMLDSKVEGAESYVIKVAGDVEVRDRSLLKGDMDIKGKLKLINGARYEGTLREGVDFKFEDIMKKEVKYGSTDRIIEYFPRPSYLDPGDYRDVVVRSKAQLIIPEGVFNMRKFILEPDAVIILKGVNFYINVSDELNFGDRYYVKLERPDGNWCCGYVYIYTNSKNVIISESWNDMLNFSNHRKYITAPEGRVLIKSRVNYVGGIRAKKIYMEPDVKGSFWWMN